MLVTPSVVGRGALRSSPILARSFFLDGYIGRIPLPIYPASHVSSTVQFFLFDIGNGNLRARHFTYKHLTTWHLAIILSLRVCHYI